MAERAVDAEHWTTSLSAALECAACRHPGNCVAERSRGGLVSHGTKPSRHTAPRFFLPLPLPFFFLINSHPLLASFPPTRLRPSCCSASTDTARSQSLFSEPRRSPPSLASRYGDRPPAFASPLPSSRLWVIGAASHLSGDLLWSRSGGNCGDLLWEPSI